MIEIIVDKNKYVLYKNNLLIIQGNKEDIITWLSNNLKNI